MAAPGETAGPSPREIAEALEEDEGAPFQWSDEPDLPGPPDPDPLPLDALPSVLRNMARTTAGATQAPQDSAIAAALGGVSAAVVGKAKVEICPRRGWVKPVHEYIGIEQMSGSGKSPLINFVRAPLAQCERERAEKEAPKRRWAEERLRLAEDRVKAARKAAVDPKDREAENDLRTALEALTEAEREPHGPFALLVSDATEEALVRVLAANGGRAASVDPEGTILEVAAGRYGNGDARLAALTHGWDGEAMTQDRVTRLRVDLPSTNLALLLALQPGVLQGMLNAETMRQRGVLARFLWVAPRMRWNEVRTGRDVPELDGEAVKRYEDALARIFHSSDKSEGAHVLKMSPEAQEGVYRLEQARVDGMRPGGPLTSVPAFAGKLPDHGSRVAALLTIADRAAGGVDLYRDPIPGWAMDSAERLMAAISTHVVKVTGDAGGDERLEDLRYLLQRLRDLHRGSVHSVNADVGGVTLRDLHRAVQGRPSITRVEDVAALVDDLEARGCVRQIVRPSTGGQPPSPFLDLHPSLRRSSDRSDRSSPAREVEATSVTSVTTKEGGVGATEPLPELFGEEGSHG